MKGYKAFIALQDPENENTVWLQYPDGLRLIERDGKYVGFYYAGEKDD